jgi:4'-phosphopantetheinyl transferase
MIWHPQPEKASLSREELHVWRFQLDVPPPIVEELAQRLSPSERLRAQQMRFERDWRTLIVSRGVLRGLLGMYLNVPPKSLEFHYNEFGKPFLSPALAFRIEFSVSHSGDRALFAFVREVSVGVDLEAIRPLADLAGMVKTCLSPSEQQRFGALPTDQRLASFFRIWTRKEALSKAIGTGLLDTRLDLDALDPKWQIVDVDVGPGFSAALAVQHPELRAEHWEGSADAI